MLNSLQKSSFIFSVVLLLFLPVVSFSKTQKEPSVPTLSLKKAINKKYVSVIISGSYQESFYQDIIDKEGLHFGKCMSIVLQSTSDKPFNLELKAGTELIPEDSTFQTMIVTKTVLFPIMTGSYYGTRFYAMCGELHDAPPYVNALYTVGDFADKNVVRLANYFDQNYIQNMVGQHALWAYTDKANAKELIKYGADTSSIRLSAEMLNAVNIETPLNNNAESITEEKQKEEKPFDILTIVLAGISVFFLSTTVLLFSKRKKMIKENPND